MKKYQVLATYNNGNIVNYTYEGNGEYNEQNETAYQRAVRHMTNSRTIKSFEIKELN